jgi:hypothetical protein
MRERFFIAVFICCFCSCKKETEEIQATVYTANGNITSQLDEFRTTIGPLNTTPNATGGRREVNWDGVPDSLLNKALPHNFFNPVGNDAPAARQRGLVYDDGTFQASSSRFDHLNPEAASEFVAFSGDKLFANVSKLQWPIGFEVAGQNQPASVKAFGMVFADVDVEGSVTLQFFNGNVSLGKYNVPASNAISKFSFFGIHFHNRSITKVIVQHQGRISDGKKDISQGGQDDLVVIDDIIYSEPVKQQE